MQVLSADVNTYVKICQDMVGDELQYSTASSKAWASVSMLKPREIVSSAVPVATCIGYLSVSGSAVQFRFDFRDLTFPGGSHLNLAGFTSPYPGHWSPDLVHLLHAGRVESHTTRRRRHSQQWRLGFSSMFGVVPEESNSGLVRISGTRILHELISGWINNGDLLPWRHDDWNSRAAI